MKTLMKRERGQSLILFAAALVGIVALLALVVDAGNAYVEKRKMQNAIDSGSSAGALALAQNKNNGAIASAISNYVRANGVDPSRIRAYYVVEDANGNNIVVRNSTVDAYGFNNPAPKTINVGGSALPVVGVQLEGDKTFNTFFAGLIGFRQMTVNGAAASYAKCGACSAGGLFPATISVGTFVDENNDGTPDAHYEQSDPTYTYRIWENKQSSPGNFGWLNWGGGTQPSEATLLDNIQNTSNSGTWRVNDLVPGTPGTKMTQNMENLITSLYISPGQSVTIPLYDQVSGTGNNTKYRIKAFARFRITAIGKVGNDKYIEGKFQQWVDAVADGGCVNFGVCTVKTRPPIDTQRTLLGTVKLQKLTLTQSTPTNVHVPVDVVNVMDISGSMRDSFGSTTKLQAAKNALTAFNNKMQPALGDKVGLVTYPLLQSGSRYNYNCTANGSHTTYYFAQQRSALTTNIASVNSIISGLTADGGTPIGAGIQQGRQTVLGAGHNSNTPAVLIVASDGLANIRLTGKWTGFSGSSSNSPSCNSGAVQDAIDQANLAKGDTNPADGKPDTIIFSIAVGDDFNPSAMQAIATPDTDPNKPHYFRVTDANSMQSIYDQIANRVQQIGSETCQIITTEAFAGGASVSIRNQNTGTTYNVQTNSVGEFILTNADPGTYVIQSASVTINGITYNVFTDGVGGPPLSSNPTVDVLIGSDTYKTDVFLKASTTPSCGN
jgi:hypothetical protein